MADVQQKGDDEIFCSSCGTIIKKAAEICPKCGVRQKEASINMNKQRIALAIASGFGMLATFLPWVSVKSESFSDTKFQSISGTNMHDGIGWISFGIFALPLIIAFLGDHTKPLAKIKYIVASIGWINIVFNSGVIIYEITEKATVGLGLVLVIIAGIAVYFISIFAKWFGNKESVITKFGIIISLITPFLLLFIFAIIAGMANNAKKKAAFEAVRAEMQAALGEQTEGSAIMDTPITITVNYTEGLYLKCEIQLEYDPLDIQLGTELEAREARIKDIVINIMSSKSPRNLMTINGKKAIREEIVAAVNNILPKEVDGKPLGKVRNSYFDSFSFSQR